jgi:GT2 family glycosyltransferase
MLAVGGEERPRAFALGADPAEFGHGANFAVRREALEAIQGFDEALGVGTRFAGAEEHDAFWRIMRAGWAGRYEPRIEVVHNQWRSRRQYLRSEYGYGMGEAAFAVKALRLERRAGLRLLGNRLWRFGVKSVFRAIRQRYETGAAGDTIRLAGIVVGTAAASRMPLDGTRFAAPDDRRA